MTPLSIDLISPIKRSLFLKKIVLSKVNWVDLDTISEKSWMKAFQLVKQIDEVDAPFVALSLNMNSYLWSGDKKLKNGLKDLGYDKVIETDSLLEIRRRWRNLKKFA